MTLTGRVENGAIVLDEPAELPEGARVEVRVIQTGRRPLHPEVEWFANLIRYPESIDPDRVRADHHGHLLRKHR